MTDSGQTQYVLYSWIAGQVLARRRQQAGVGQVDMAKALNVSQATWSRIEGGTSPLTVEQLSHSAALLGLSATEIIVEVDQLAEQYRQGGYYVIYQRAKEPLNIPALAAAGLGLYGLVKVLSKSDEE